jgi:signal transduction histidine kinase
MISLRLDEHNVTLCIQDDGQGFCVPDELLPMVEQGKYGLLGCVERAGAIGGHVTIRSEPGNGVQLEVVAPLT